MREEYMITILILLVNNKRREVLWLTIASVLRLLLETKNEEENLDRTRTKTDRPRSFLMCCFCRCPSLFVVALFFCFFIFIWLIDTRSMKTHCFRSVLDILWPHVDHHDYYVGSVGSDQSVEYVIAQWHRLDFSRYIAVDPYGNFSGDDPHRYQRILRQSFGDLCIFSNTSFTNSNELFYRIVSVCRCSRGHLCSSTQHLLLSAWLFMETRFNPLWPLGFIRCSPLYIEYSQSNLHLRRSLHGHHQAIDVHRLSIEISRSCDDFIGLDRFSCHHLSAYLRLERQKSTLQCMWSESFTVEKLTSASLI